MCCQLRTKEEKARIPILLMVTSEDEIMYFTRHEPHRDDYIKKPLLWEELHACITTLLRRGKRGYGNDYSKIGPFDNN